jgi:DNA-binding transcriptional LysR family regulator
MTDAGEEFYRYAVLMLREAELAETAIRHRLNEPKGTVRCTAYAVRNARYRARLSPPLSEGPCRCHATDQNVDIVGENYDVAIAAPPENKSTMTACQTLAQSPQRLPTSPVRLSITTISPIFARSGRCAGRDERATSAGKLWI